MNHRHRSPGLVPLAAALLLASVGFGLIACASAPPPDSLTDVPSAAQLYQRGQKLLQGQPIFVFFHTVNYGRAIDTFQSVIDNYPYSRQAVQAELAIANAYFKETRYDEALSYYRDFGDLHPENPKVAYTIYRAALCYARQSHDPGWDQTATHQALDYLDRLLSKYPHSEYAPKAEKLWRKLRTRLASDAMKVGDFYLAREEYPSAAERYRGVLNQFPGLGLDAQALYKLGLCYRRMHRADEAQKIFQVLLDNYRGSEVAKAAANLVPAAN